MRVSSFVALTAALCLAGTSAFAFGAPRTGCTVSVASQGAWLTMEVYSEETGWPEAPAERQARQWEKKIVSARFRFPSQPSAADGGDVLRGSLFIDVVAAGSSIYPVSPWRDEWEIGSSLFDLGMPAEWEGAVAEVQIKATTEGGEVELWGRHRPGFAAYGTPALNVTPSSTDDGAFARMFEGAEHVELHVLRESGDMLGVVAFDLSQAGTLIEEFTNRMPMLLETYEFGTEIDEFVCNEDITL